MLVECFGKLAESKIVRALRTCLHSIWVNLIVVALMVLSNLFALELVVFYVYLAIGALYVLFDDDLKGIVPIALCCYMTISYQNNPAFHLPGEETVSAFYDPAFKVQLIFVIVVAAVLLVGRLVSLLLGGSVAGDKRRGAPRLWFGFLVLALSMVLGGIFSGYYSARSAFFGFTVAASLCGLYFFFLYAIDWKKFDLSYYAYALLFIGFGVIAELMEMYLRTGMLEGNIDRGVLITGWGMYNNLGCVIACCIPAVVYLAAKKRHGWIFTCLSFVMFVGLLFTQSRSGILFGGAVYLVSLIVMLVLCGKKERFAHFVVLSVALVAVIAVVACFYEKLFALFRSAIDKTFGDDPSNNRRPIYELGIKQFLEAPCFGVGFYQADRGIIFQWGHLPESAFLPPRYHNTYIQMMASCGVFGLICYVWHRVETVILICRRPTTEKSFLAMCILPFLLTSLVECHMFSFGPALFYAVFLALAEGSDRART